MSPFGAGPVLAGMGAKRVGYPSGLVSVAAATSVQGRTGFLVNWPPAAIGAWSIVLVIVPGLGHDTRLGTRPLVFTYGLTYGFRATTG